MRYLITLALIMCLLGCNTGTEEKPGTAAAEDITPAADTITLEDLKSDVTILASDEFEGRSPSSITPTGSARRPSPRSRTKTKMSSDTCAC